MSPHLEITADFTITEITEESHVSFLALSSQEDAGRVGDSHLGKIPSCLPVAGCSPSCPAVDPGNRHQVARTRHGV